MPGKRNQQPDLEARFREEIIRNPLWEEGHRILLAVSGGVDSVVLAHLMVNAGVECAIAHCNFQLRGVESDRDEQFTRALADTLGIPCFVEHLNTYEHAFRQGISTEMSARELRYAWFHELIGNNDFQWVATGHHADDQIETLFLNLSRGTGISGLRGMLPLAGKIVRPLLPFFRDEIQGFAVQKGISWIEDSTNSIPDIKRNFIRHNIIPLFESINPNFRKTMLRSISDLQITEKFYKEMVRKGLEPLIIKEIGADRISVPGLQKLEPLSLYLFELLSEYGFNRSSIEDIGQALSGHSGKQFFSPTHRVVKDRSDLIVTRRAANEADEDWEYFIEANDTAITDPVNITSRVDQAVSFKIPRAASVASLDYAKLTFPLILRRWLPGDTFIPFGMRNPKKLSDFFTDLKLSLPEKERTWVILSGNEIVWIVGHRIDNRFRITPKTKTIFVLTLSTTQANEP